MQKLTTPHAGSKQKHDGQACEFRTERCRWVAFQLGCRIYQPSDLRFGEDVRPEPLVIWRKCPGIRQEALGLCSPAIDAESVHLKHANTANTRREMLLGSAP